MNKILLSQLTEGFYTPKEDCYITKVTQDSREIIENSVFLAIIGERVNGEDYAKIAIDKGAKLVISEHEISDIPQDMICIVDSVLDTNIIMAKNFRKLFDTEIIAVTGSVGKTTTKDFIYAAISPFAKTARSMGNNNNELGLPKTVYNFESDDEYAILEMGMSSLNDIHKLSVATSPVCGVITNIGVSHIEHLKTQSNILKAKLEICDGMDENGILVLNKDDSFLAKSTPTNVGKVVYYGLNNETADVFAKDIEVRAYHTYFTIVDIQKGVFKCVIPAVGDHNVRNALCGYIVATRLGFDENQTINNLRNYEPSGMRQKITEINDIVFMEDCYNASPDSMKASLETLKTISKTRSIAVLGDMLELGTESDLLHFDVGSLAKEKEIDMVLCYGEQAKFICDGFENGKLFDTKKELSAYLVSILKKGDTVSFKASRGMAFEEIIDMVYEGVK